MGAYGFGFPGGPTTGNLYTSVDTYNTALENNGATCPLGTRYTYPLGVQLSPTLGFAYNSTKIGLGVPLTICYVRYNSTTNPDFLPNPGVVYWQDSTFTVVTGSSGDAADGINAIAGYALLNTTNYPGALSGAQLKAVIQGNYIWMVVAGYVPAATSITSVAAGDYLIGGGTAFTPVQMAKNSAPTNRVVGMSVTALSGAVSDVLVGSGGLGVF